MGWQDSVSAIGDVVTAGAVLVGGAWAYFRFVRGRIFAHRAEVAVAAALLRPPLSGLRVQIAVKNTGTSQLPLGDLRFVETFAVTEDDWPKDTNIVWDDPIISTRVLRSHQWLESSETVNEDVLVPLPRTNATGRPYVAYLVRAHVPSARRRKRATPTEWTAQVVVVPEGADGGKDVVATIPS